MAQDSEVATAKEGSEVTNQHPSSPTGSNSSREETRVTREQLKKTSLAGLSQKSAAQGTDSTNVSELDPTDISVDTANGIRGRPAKKRSFEDLTKDDVDADSVATQPPLPKSGHHKRMRSRDIGSADHSAYVKAEAERAETLHEESDIDAQTAPGGPAVLIDVPSQEEMDADATQPPSKQASKPEEVSGATTKTTSKEPLPSAFTNTSSDSPFGSATSSRQKPTDAFQPTSSSAFASSGLSAFAASDKSPFGAAGSGGKSPLGGGFGGQSSGGFGSAKSGFSNTGGFGSTAPSAFGGGSSTFGQPRTFGSGPSTFGAPKPFASSSAFGGDGSAFAKGKPFTSAKKEDDEAEEAHEEGDEDASSNAKDDDREQDPRFREQQIETGEDGEDTAFAARARIYIFDTAWKERGTGTFKVNIRYADNQDTPEVDEESQQGNTRRKARLLMRADATHRVILNSPVFKGMQFGAYGNTAPTGKTMTLQCQEDGKVVLLQIKIGKEEVLRKLYDLLTDLEAET